MNFDFLNDFSNNIKIVLQIRIRRLVCTLHMNIVEIQMIVVILNADKFC